MAAPELTPATRTRPPKAARSAHSAALDGLRGLAVLGVVAFHVGVLPFGWLGVPVFFVLSGHFITRVLLERRSSGRAAMLRDFARNRALRLAPLYLLACLALTVLAVTGGGPRQLAGDLPYLWTWTYDLHPLVAGFVDNNLYDHLWSLAVEVQLYLVWAGLALWLSRRWFVRVVLALAVGGPVVRLLVWVGLLLAGYPHDRLAAVTYELPTTYLDAFAIGAVTAIPEIRARLWPARRSLAITGGAVLVVVCGEVGLAAVRHGQVLTDLGFPIGCPYQLGWVWEYSLIAVFAGALVLAAARDGRVAGVLSRPMLARAGLLSYGIYVLHRPLVELADRMLPARPGWPELVAATVVVAGASTLCAAISHRWLERPFIARKRNALTP
ncbi:MAG TPA: acyltransferase [Pseudonocardiaceae bacterium]|nr:acyltransferase [Pseudonocardiaceae bacterium]